MDCWSLGLVGRAFVQACRSSRFAKFSRKKELGEKRKDRDAPHARLVSDYSEILASTVRIAVLAVPKLVLGKTDLRR
jgi:hypothetical protein